MVCKFGRVVTVTSYMSAIRHATILQKTNLFGDLQLRRYTSSQFDTGLHGRQPMFRLYERQLEVQPWLCLCHPTGSQLEGLLTHAPARGAQAFRCTNMATCVALPRPGSAATTSANAGGMAFSISGRRRPTPSKCTS